MMRSPLSFCLVAFFALVVGRVAAQADLTINVAGFKNVSATEFLQTTDVVLQDCSGVCPPAQQAIAACTDNKCLCANNNTQTDVVPLITSCEQCMFAALITRNKLPEDPLAGQATTLTAYKTACNAINATTGIILDATALTLTPPANWDGPFGQGLNVGTTVISVIAAALLGSGLIGVLISM